MSQEERPLCKCGCGRPIESGRYKGTKYRLECKDNKIYRSGALDDVLNPDNKRSA